MVSIRTVGVVPYYMSDIIKVLLKFVNQRFESMQAKIIAWVLTVAIVCITTFGTLGISVILFEIFLTHGVNVLSIL